MVVGCIIEKDNAVMLCRRGIEPRKGYWNLPCGFLENNETVQDGAAREVLEETGAAVILEGLHTVYNLPHANQVYLIFKASLQKDATWHLTPESTEIEFFKLSDIPWDEIAFSSNSHAIKHLIAQKADSKTPIVSVGTYIKESND
jgi:ADP-ribose pyrophosphatase YjhB (NUDIX family)